MGVIESDQPLPLTWSPETALWKSPLPIDGGEPDHSQSSPIIHGDRIFVTTSAWPAGAEKSKSQPVIWQVASPVAAKNLVFCMGGRGGHPGLIVDPVGKGEVEPKFSLGPAAEGLGSPVAFGDLVFRLNKPGVLRCVRITTGEQIFEERLEGADPAISPVVTRDGRIYIASAGKTVVIRAAER